MRSRIWLGILSILSAGILSPAAGVLPDSPRTELPAAQNAYVVWAQMLPEFKHPHDKAFTDAYFQALHFQKELPTGEGRKQLDAWIESKENALYRISQGLARKRLQFPVVATDKDLNWDAPAKLRDVGNIKTILARESAERGKNKAAVDEWMEVFKMGRLIADGDGLTLHYLTGMAMQRQALRGLRWLAGKNGVPPDELRFALWGLPVPQDEDPGLAQMYRNEAKFMNWSIQKIEMDGLSPKNNLPITITNVLDVAATCKLADTFNARFIQNALTRWPDRDTKIEEDARKLAPPKELTPPGTTVSLNGMDMCFYFLNPNELEEKKKWQQLEALGRQYPNIGGRMFLSSVFPTYYMGSHIQSVKLRTEINLTRAFLAMSIWDRENATRPESLENPRFKALLEQEPTTDLFSGKPVRYSREKGILWSVGPDGIDDGGDEQKDFVIKLPALAPKPVL